MNIKQMYSEFFRETSGKLVTTNALTNEKLN